MDLTELYETFNTELFTDVTLILTDEHREIKLRLHKIVLYSACIYFKKLLTNFKEKDSNEIIIIVPNAYVTYDIIMSFYGQKTNIGNIPKWKHLLESVKCKDYLGLKYDYFIIKGIRVPEEGFELLLEICELLDYHNDILKTIMKNIPKGYDLRKISIELKRKIMEVHDYRIVSQSHDNSIKIWNAETGSLIRTLKFPGDGHVLSVSYSPDNKRIASQTSNYCIQIWNAQTCDTIL